MIGLMTSWYRRSSLRAGAGVLLVFLGAACTGGGQVDPSSEAALPADSAATAPLDPIVPGTGDPVPPSDSATTPASDTLASPPPDGTSPSGDDTSTLPGIVFGSFGLATEALDGVHTAAIRAPDPGNILALLAAVKAKGGRLVLTLMQGGGVRNTDGTFSFTKWKAKIDAFKGVNLAPYIADGTILGHYLLDEPYDPSNWGGHVVPQQMIEAMAEHSKQIWPGMTTFVRAHPTWLASAPIAYRYLDASWAQYEGYPGSQRAQGEVSSWITREVAAAQKIGVGLMVGMNVLNGGSGSSRIAGTSSGKYSMSAAELRTYGIPLLNQGYACGFYMWRYSATYYTRADIRSAMAELSVMARNHAKTSCRQ